MVLQLHCSQTPDHHNWWLHLYSDSWYRLPSMWSLFSKILDNCLQWGNRNYKWIWHYRPFADDCGPIITGDKVKTYNLIQPKQLQCYSAKKNTNQNKDTWKKGEKFIKHANSVKYLGLILDRKFNWREHNDKVDTCKGLLLNIINKYRQIKLNQN